MLFKNYNNKMKKNNLNNLGYQFQRQKFKKFKANLNILKTNMWIIMKKTKTF